MTFKVVQMVSRGFLLILMTLGLFYSSECHDLTSLTHFVITGVYGSFAVVTLGLLIEAGMNIYSDVFIETTFIVLGMLLNLLVTVLAFYEYYFDILPTQESMSKGFVSIASAIIFLIDLFLLHGTR